MAGGGTINYYKNDGSSVYVSYSIYDNGPTPKTISEIGWSRSGYEFVNWNTSSDGTGTIYGIDTPAPSSGTTNLYAIWEALPDIDITYKGSSITTMSASGTEVLETEGKYCEDDITVTYTKTAGSASTPATTITANPTISISSGGLITASVSGSQSVTPTVSAGYVSSGIAGTITVSGSNTSQLTTQAAQTIHPSTTDQTIASGKYLTGTQTLKGVLLTNLSADNIKKDVVVKVGDSTDDDCVTSVTGTFEGSGGGPKDFIEQHGTMTSFTDSTVTIIGRGAFAHCSSLATVSIPSCTRIDSYAFQNCFGLTTVSFPSCTRIGSNAFQNCSSLTTVSIPLCTRIESYAFAYCLQLTTASFSLCTSIGSYAFQNCFSLTTISFPLCKSIGNYAFQSCRNLTAANFPSCTSMGNSTFWQCWSLSVASFPLCTSIGSYAFQNCSSLATISFPSCTYIGTSAFANCSSLVTVSFPSCTYISTSAFAWCRNLTTANFPSCTSISSYAFYNCDKLTTVSISLCANINNSAFAGCSSLTTVNFPLCTSIGNQVFSFCLKLTTVSLPSCTYIGSAAFDRCYSLLSLYLTGSSIASLSNSNAFNSTPIAGYTASTGGVYGSIFVPSSLYSTYIAATNWTYFSSRIVSV